MDSESRTAQLLLQVSAGPDADPEELDRATRNLRNELRELDVESAELVREGESPEGAKSADPVTLGALAVAVLPVVVPRLVEYLQAWTLRGEGRTVKVKTQVGDRTVELEFSPKEVAQTDMQEMVQALVTALEPKK